MFMQIHNKNLNTRKIEDNFGHTHIIVNYFLSYTFNVGLIIVVIGKKVINTYV